MRFRPCIDIHNGQVKQIVGGSLKDQGDQAKENFVSSMSAADYARLYTRDRLTGGHIILLNPATSPYFEQTKRQAMEALKAAPGMFQIGGGINPENAGEYLEAGAFAVIVTSYVFKDGKINYENLDKMVKALGREHLVLDLSCRKRDGQYWIVTDRWQKFTDVVLTKETLEELSGYCCEFLIHAADVEGKAAGPDLELTTLLGSFEGVPVTYAGGIHSFEDLELIRRCGRGHIDFTVGSALDLFGGDMPYEQVIRYTDGQ